jgi:hypothetical protein
MPLQRIGNRSVYVITPPDPEVAKTSTGVSWAQYYTSLRWDTWQRVAEAQAQNDQLRALAFKANMDIFEQQRRDLNRAILEMEQLRAETLAGGNTAGQIARATRDRRREAQTELNNIRKILDAAEGTEVTIDTPYEGPESSRVFVDENNNIVAYGAYDTAPAGTRPLTERTTRVTVPRISAQRRQMYRDREAELVAQLAGTPTVSTDQTVREETVAEAPGAALRRKDAIKSIDAAIEDFEQQLQGLQTPQLPIENQLERTRRAYEQQIGVIGRGGGPFGLAPRPTRTSPRFSEAELSQRIGDLEQSYINNALSALPEDASIEDQALAIQDAREQALSDLRSRGAEPVARGEFLRRDEEYVPTPPPVPDISNQTDLEVMGVSTGPAITYDDERRIEEEEDALGDVPPAPFTPPTVTRISPIPPVVGDGDGDDDDTDDTDETLPPIDGPPRITPIPPVVTPPGEDTGDDDDDTDGDDEDANAQNEAEKIKNDFADFQKDTIPQDLIDRAREWAVGTTIQVDGGEPRPIMETFETDKDMVGAYLLDIVRRDTPVQQYLPQGIEQQIQNELAEFRASPTRSTRSTRRQARRQTRAQKNASYFLEVMQKGSKLAEQPKRLERIAKTDLPDEERPEVVKIVEDLLQVSKGRANYFRDVFDEITRYYKDDPVKMQQAHEYLAALELLDTQVRR